MSLDDQQQSPEDRPSSTLKPWVAPLAVGSVVVFVLGLIFAYANLTAGAVIALLGFAGVVVVGREAARSAGE